MLSICVPTYNRKKSLTFLLDSIIKNKSYKKNNFEICISDNCSNYNIQNLIKKYKKRLNIKLNIFDKNYGRVVNMIKVVSMATKKYVWLIGDDEIFLDNTLSKLENILKNYNYIDFFYLNFFFAEDISFDKHLNLKKKKLKKNFDIKDNYILPFKNLFNVKINPDIFGGMFQSIFKKELWNNFFKTSNISEGIKSKSEFSTYTNTFPHSYIFSKSFNNPLSMVISDPIIIVTSSFREWANLYPYVRSFRLLEILELNYKKKNITLLKYIYIKNFLLRYYFVDLLYLFFKERKRLYSLNFSTEITKFLYLFPYIYFIYYIVNKIFKKFKL